METAKNSKKFILYSTRGCNMSPMAFRRLLDAYVRASVDLEFCHMNGYDKKNKRFQKIYDKLMEVYYESKFWNIRHKTVNDKKVKELLKRAIQND